MDQTASVDVHRGLVAVFDMDLLVFDMVMMDNRLVWGAQLLSGDRGSMHLVLALLLCHLVYRVFRAKKNGLHENHWPFCISSQI